MLCKGGKFMKTLGIRLNGLKKANRKIISFKESVENVTPFKWNEKVLSGKTKVIISADKKK